VKSVLFAELYVTIHVSREPCAGDDSRTYL